MKFSFKVQNHCFKKYISSFKAIIGGILARTNKNSC